MIDTETDALVEAMAKAMAEASDDYDGEVLQFVPYLDDARALLPIVTAHTAAAVAAERERVEQLEAGLSHIAGYYGRNHRITELANETLATSHE
jgi:hypothetical protein